jgi:hypothetical protein
VGFALTAYPAGVERGWVSREAARDRTLATLRFFWNAPQGPAPQGMTGDHGFFYHFLDMETGHRFETVELSTIDTTLFIAGALAAQAYFDGADPAEAEIRDLAEKLYRRIDWRWAQVRKPAISMGWTPEHGTIDYDYRGYNEAMLLYVLALGSPTHPAEGDAWGEYMRTAKWGELYGERHVTFPPLFGHQYSHVWIDFRGIRDAAMREHGPDMDYFENSRRATRAQRAYAIENPQGWRGYGENVWGLSACDGPLDGTLTIDGRSRTFRTYSARGVAPDEMFDDGTLTPAAAAGSLPFAPDIALPALQEMDRRYGEHLSGKYGFLDAFNPTLGRAPPPGQTLHHGKVVPGVGWFDTDYLGIDQGVTIAMIENWRSGLVWRLMRQNPHLVRGLERAGFQGGWLRPAAP